MNDTLKVEVFIHSHWKTGEPIDFHIFSVCGLVYYEWLKKAIFQLEGNFFDRKEIAENFYQVSKTTENINWYEIRPVIEVGDGNNTAFYFDVLGVVQSPDPELKEE